MANPWPQSSASRSPALDVSETERAYTVKLEIPGAAKEDVKVSVEGRQVTVQASTQRSEEKKDGERIVYRERATMGSRGGGKPFYASPVLIGDKLVCVSRRDGAFVLAAKPKYELLSTNEFANDTTHFNATPAVSGDLLILRSNKAVYCVGLK
mgnify:CR=1 FL=1